MLTMETSFLPSCRCYTLNWSHILSSVKWRI